jgi:hypothetical protein
LPNIKYILATCVADDGFVRHGTMLGESYQVRSFHPTVLLSARQLAFSRNPFVIFVCTSDHVVKLAFGLR